MPRYTVQHAYRAARDGARVGPWVAGEEVDVDQDLAEWVNRDSPGALADVKPEPKSAPPRKAAK